MRVWTPEARAAHAALMRAKIHTIKPWLSSTGPRTVAGKKASSLNALKHGRRCYGMRRMAHVAGRHRRFLFQVNAIIREKESCANELIKALGGMQKTGVLLC